ncbi:MAG: OadG family protein [Candidatus Accumulibacter sp.]|jgi:sodium pump decarboxylase gamma subunit|nr:OadG family protein [Accumulibacter sp.]
MNPETLALGVQTTVVGLGVVFSMLTILWGVVTWLDKIVESMSQKQSPPAPAPVPAVAPAVPASAGSAASNVKTVAAIMGAISAISGVPLGDLKFTAIQRADGPRLIWSEAGVAEVINTRQQFL